MRLEEKLIVEQDELDRARAIMILMKKWGKQYRKKTIVVKAFINSAPSDLAGARLPNGRAVFNDAKMVEWFYRVAKK